MVENPDGELVHDQPLVPGIVAGNTGGMYDFAQMTLEPQLLGEDLADKFE
jgi:hypothetical protein